MWEGKDGEFIRAQQRDVLQHWKRTYDEMVNRNGETEQSTELKKKIEELEEMIRSQSD